MADKDRPANREYSVYRLTKSKEAIPSACSLEKIFTHSFKDSVAPVYQFIIKEDPEYKEEAKDAQKSTP